MPVNNEITGRNAFSTWKIIFRKPYSIFIRSLPPPAARYPEAGMGPHYRCGAGTEKACRSNVLAALDHSSSSQGGPCRRARRAVHCQADGGRDGPEVPQNHREVDTMSTGNAEMNAAIRPVNAGAGFKMHRRFVEYRAGRDALDIWSSARAHAKLFIT
jgi:hypothetical protein